MRLIAALLFCFSIIVSALAQKPPFEVEVFKNSSYYGKSVICLKNRGYATLEATDEYTYIQPAKLTKYDECLNVIWSRKIIVDYTGGLIGRGWSNFLLETTDSGIILTNMRNQLGNGWPVVHKIDYNGNLVWSKELFFDVPNASASGGSLTCAVATEDGGIVAMSSNIYKTPTIEESFNLIVKLNSQGNIVWTKKYILPPKNNVYYVYGASGENLIKKMPDGGFLVSMGGQSGNLTSLFMRIDSVGNLIWIKGFDRDGNNNDIWINETIIDKAGNIYLIGNKGYLERYGIVQKLNNSGVILWTKKFTNQTLLYSGKETNEGTIVFQGYQYTNGYKNIFGEIDFDGNLKWIKHPSNNFWASYYNNRIAVDSENNMIVPSNKVLLKINGKGIFPDCNLTDTMFLLENSYLPSKNHYATISDGYKIRDTIWKIEKVRTRPKLICGAEYYPIADLHGDTILCANTSYTLKIGEHNLGYGHKFYWSTGDTTESITVTKSGKYWLAISSGYCTNTDTVNIIFRNEIKSILQDRYICNYDSTLLQAPKHATANFYWKTPNQSIFEQHDIWAKDSGNYYLFLAGTENCKAIDTVEVKYYPMPDASAGPDTMLCYNQSYEMQGKGGISYKWIPAKYLSSDTIANPIATAPDTQLYTLIVKNAFGCADTSEVWLKVRPKLQINLTANTTTTCSGEDVIFNAVVSGGMPQNYTFKWKDFDEKTLTLNAKFKQSQWIKFAVTDGCSEPANDSIFINVKPAPTAKFRTLPLDTGVEGKQVNFINQSIFSNSYIWNFGDGKTTTEANPNYIYADTGKYFISLIALNSNGCADTATGVIYIKDKLRIFIPNVFTPDDNSHNEVFAITGTGIKNYDFQVYNRWGELIFETTETEKNWNGKYKGQFVQDDVYIYTLKAEDYSKQKYYYNGTVNVLR